MDAEAAAAKSTDDLVRREAVYDCDGALLLQLSLVVSPCFGDGSEADDEGTDESEEEESRVQLPRSC